MDWLAVVTRLWLYGLTGIVAFFVGALVGVNQIHRFYLRKSVARVSMLRQSANAGNPAGLVEAPGAESLHWHLFGEHIKRETARARVSA